MTCDEIKDCLIDYLNHKLSSKENIEIVRHLAICTDCRNELCSLIKLMNHYNAKQTEVPNEILQCAFKEIVVKENPITFVTETIYYSLKLIMQTVKFALQLV